MSWETGQDDPLPYTAPVYEDPTAYINPETGQGYAGDTVTATAQAFLIIDGARAQLGQLGWSGPTYINVATDKDPQFTINPAFQSWLKKKGYTLTGAIVANQEFAYVKDANGKIVAQWAITFNALSDLKAIGAVVATFVGAEYAFGDAFDAGAVAESGSSFEGIDFSGVEQMNDAEYAEVFDNVGYTSGESVTATSDAQTVDFGMGQQGAESFDASATQSSMVPNADVPEVSVSYNVTPETATSDFGVTTDPNFGSLNPSDWQQAANSIGTTVKTVVGTAQSLNTITGGGAGQKNAVAKPTNPFDAFLSFFGNLGQGSLAAQNEAQVNKTYSGQLQATSMRLDSLPMMLMIGGAVLIGGYLLVKAAK